MSLFYGSLKGQAKTEATRRGTADSGVSAHVRGWKSGIKISVEELRGKPSYRIELTSGSTPGKSDRTLLVLPEKDLLTFLNRRMNPSQLPVYRYTSNN